MASDGGYGAKIGFDPNAGHTRGPGVHAGDDFPMLCETCLGPNPYVRMIKTTFGNKLCKISNVPYQGFRWKAGPQGRYKETLICYAVARERNICQTCLNDMQYGLPVGVRDSLLAKKDNQITAPQSDVGKAVFYAQQAQRSADQAAGSYTNDMTNVAASGQLDRFSRGVLAASSRQSAQTAFRNLPKLCSFWLNGTCSRVARKVCPFRPCCGTFVFPELAATHRDLMAALVDRLNKDGPADVQKKLDAETKAAFRDSMRGNRDDSIRKRVYGDDDLTRKYLGKFTEGQTELAPPSDPTIATLWAGNLTPDISPEDIRAAFCSYGRVVNIHVVAASKCAFVEFAARAEAEHAAQQLYNTLTVKGQALTLNWAKPRAQAAVEGGGGARAPAPPGAMAQLPPPPGMEYAPKSAYALPGMAAPAFDHGNQSATGGPVKRQRVGEQTVEYPSMNPGRMGSKL